MNRIWVSIVLWKRKICCMLGLHRYIGRPIIASIDTYWVCGGKQCVHCKKGSVEVNEARTLIECAYDRGKDRTNTAFIAYGRGIEKIVKVYGKKYVQETLDKLP